MLPRTSLLLLVLVACDRRRPLEPASTGSAASEPRSEPPSPAAAPARPCTLSEVPLRYPAPKRLVAIGDVHGDVAATRSALKAAGAIDDADRWIGGDLVVVQVGDQLDRGDDEQAILDLLFKLEPEAQAAGGRLIVLLGNHELMNAAGDFRYVTPGALHDFDDVPGLDTSKWTQAPERVRARIAALGPGGPYAKKLAAHNVVVVVGDVVLSHAGILGPYAAKLEEVNRSTRCWLDGQAGGIQDGPPSLTDDDGPTWTREYGGPEVDCSKLQTALATIGAKRMVVGHTVQQRANAQCDGALWRIDVGLGKLYGGPIEVLELLPTTRVISGTRTN